MTATIAEMAEALADCPEAQDLLAKLEDSFFYTFRPRPDNPARYDEQQSFVEDRIPGVAGLIGGNASGTSESAAYKLSQFVLNRQLPPRQDTPFWIVGPKIDQTIKTFWKEKLFGHGHIPHSEIDWKRIRWHSEKQALPFSVPLLPWPESKGGDPHRNWCIEFRSFAEGTAVMTAESIGGFCCTEPFPRELLTEIMRATREYNYPGSMFFELTPVDPSLTYWIEEMIVDDKVPDTWKFYRCNLECNAEDPNSVVGKKWATDFLESVSDEMVETRKTGAFASYEGLIYQSFNRAIHVVDDMEIPTTGVIHKRSIDWGASEEHPFVCVFAYKDAVGVWNVYGEYHSTDQTMLWADHCEVIKGMYPWMNNHPTYRETYGDPSRPDLFREFSNNGIPVTPAKNDVDQGIEAVRRFLKVHPLIGPKLRVASWCKQVIKEFFTYRWEQSSGRGINPRVAKPKPLKKYDDAMDALRYLIFTDYRSNIGGASSHRTEQRRRPQVRHKRHHDR